MEDLEVDAIIVDLGANGLEQELMEWKRRIQKGQISPVKKGS